MNIGFVVYYIGFGFIVYYIVYGVVEMLEFMSGYMGFVILKSICK